MFGVTHIKAFICFIEYFLLFSEIYVSEVTTNLPRARNDAQIHNQIRLESCKLAVGARRRPRRLNLHVMKFCTHPTSVSSKTRYVPRTQKGKV